VTRIAGGRQAVATAGRPAADAAAGVAGLEADRRVADGAADGASTALSGNRAVSRALAVLRLLAQAGRPMTLAEVAGQLMLPKSSALSLLRALAGAQFAAVDKRGRYVLGLGSFEVGAAYLRSMTPVRAVEGELQALTDVLGVTSHFAVLEEDEVVYLAKHDPPRVAVQLASSVGARLPAASTAVGKAQLAFRAERGHLSGVARDLAARLEEVRKRGYAVDEGETLAGVRCVAAPVFNSGGCCGAIGVSYLIQSTVRLDDAAAAVVSAAGQASARLGGLAADGRAG
jgi:DNA-binding IclR family transcriptional regulator